MSQLRYLLKNNRICQCDKRGNFIAELSNDGQITEIARTIYAQMCESWNKMDWAETSKYFDEPVKGKVLKSVAKPCSDGDGICITTTFIEGFRFSEKRRNAFWEEMDAQMSDGWGEGEFGPGNRREFAYTGVEPTYAYIE